MLVIGLIVGGLWIIIALIGLLPTPRNPSIKMALRSFSRHRGRTATTLMVMIVGLFFISFITFVADSVKATIRSAFDIQLGYNTIGFSGLLTGSSAQITEQTVANLGAIKGIQKVYPGNFASTRAISINGNNTSTTGTGFSVSLSGRSFVNGESAGGINTKKVLEGRNLTPADADSNVLLVSKSRAASNNLKVGDTLTLRSQGAFGSSNSTNRPTADFKIVGIMDEGNQTVNVEGDWVAPFNVVGKLGSQITIYYMLIDRGQKLATLQQTQEFLPNVLDLDDLIDTFNRLLDQILAFPLILSLLSLFSGAILVANNVALAVLERRTEIGVLKAVGAKRKRVMSILLWESGLVGLLGGIIGVGAGILIAININALTNAGKRGSGIDFTWSPGVAALLLLLGIGLALFATVVSAWGAVQEKPLVVLRYE
jgi:ABC-type antimicrobial peptide transport system permease subunit